MLNFMKIERPVKTKTSYVCRTSDFEIEVHPYPDCCSEEGWSWHVEATSASLKDVEGEIVDPKPFFRIAGASVTLELAMRDVELAHGMLWKLLVDIGALKIHPLSL